MKTNSPALRGGPRVGRLQGKRALITGAGSGIGRAVALRFADEGARLVLGDIASERARQVADEMDQPALALTVDVTKRPSIDAFVNEATSHLGGLDIVVCNAGIATVGSVEELTEDAWDDVITANLKSVYLSAKAAWPHLRTAGGGVILVTTSIGAVTGIPRDAGYCAAKAGALMLAKCMALDGAQEGIRVNAVCPGFTASPMTERFLGAQREPERARNALARLTPLGGLGKPLDQANAFVYLASDEAAWITGTALTVDGGMTSGLWPLTKEIEE